MSKLGFAGLATGILGSIGAGIGALSDRKEAKKINPVYKPYEVSPFAKERLGLARQMFGGKSSAVKMAEADISRNQAAGMYGAERAASDGSQLLAAGAMGQAQADNSTAQLAGMQEQYRLQGLSNLTGAQDAMTQELDKVYQDNLQKYMTDLNMKMAYRNAARQGFTNMMGGMMNTIGSGALGGFGPEVQALFGKKSGGGMGSSPGVNIPAFGYQNSGDYSENPF